MINGYFLGTLPVKRFFHILPTFQNERNTPPKFNIEPENDGFQKESPFPRGYFQVNHVKPWRGVNKNTRLLLRLQLGHLHPSLNAVQIESTLVNMG